MKPREITSISNIKTSHKQQNIELYTVTLPGLLPARISIRYS